MYYQLFSVREVRRKLNTLWTEYSFVRKGNSPSISWAVGFSLSEFSHVIAQGQLDQIVLFTVQEDSRGALACHLIWIMMSIILAQPLMKYWFWTLGKVETSETNPKLALCSLGEAFCFKQVMSSPQDRRPNLTKAEKYAGVILDWDIEIFYTLVAVWFNGVKNNEWLSIYFLICSDILP